MKTFAATLGLAVVIAFAGCDHKKKSKLEMPARPATPVSAAAAVAKDVPVYIEEIGKTAAREAVTIQPQVGGKIMAIQFTDGAELKKGQLLFTIDPRPYEATVRQAEATLAENQADVKWSQSELKRVQGLAGTGAISAQEVELKQNALAVAEAKVQGGEASLQQAKLNLEYCQITSPIDGRAGQRLIDVGNVVNSSGPDGGTKLLTIQRVDPIYADFVIPEQELGRVREQMRKGTLKTQVWIPNQADTTPREGELTFLDNAVEKDAGTIKLRATLPNQEGYFWPGQFVKVRLVLQVLNDAVLVPAMAQQIGQQGPFVFVVKQDEIEDPVTKKKSTGTVAELRPVKPGQRQGDMLVILDGLKAGEQVITEGQMMVRPGTPVMVAPSAEKHEPPTSKPAAVAEGAVKS